MRRKIGVDEKPRDEEKEFQPVPFISVEIKERKESKPRAVASVERLKPE